MAIPAGSASKLVHPKLDRTGSTLVLAPRMSVAPVDRAVCSCTDTDAIIEAIRTELGEKVNAPGRRALQAVLALRRNSSMSQADAAKTFKTSKDSIRKYSDFVAKLAPQNDVADTVAPAAGIVAASLGTISNTASVLVLAAEASTCGRPLLSRDWLAHHMPSVQEIRVQLNSTPPPPIPTPARPSDTLPHLIST